MNFVLRHTIENAIALYKAESRGTIFAEFANETYDRDGRRRAKCYDMSRCGCQCNDTYDIPPGSNIKEVLGIYDLKKISEEEFATLWMQCEYPPMPANVA